MTECPLCHKQAISQLRMYFMEPWYYFPCRACHKEIRVSWLIQVASAPFQLSMLAAAFLALQEMYIFSGLSLAVGFASTAAIYTFLVPLVPRGA